MYRRAKCPAFLFASIPVFAEIKLRQLERALHGAGGEDLRAVVQVRVDIGRGTDVAVPQPLLDLFHGHAVFEQQGCTAVPQIVQADVPQPLFPQQLAETVGDIAGFKDVAHLVDEHIAQILRVVAVAADLPVSFLLVPEGQKLRLELPHQRQGAEAGSGLGAVGLVELQLSVHQYLG